MKHLLTTVLGHYIQTAGLVLYVMATTLSITHSHTHTFVLAIILLIAFAESTSRRTFFYPLVLNLLLLLSRSMELITLRHNILIRLIKSLFQFFNIIKVFLLLFQYNILQIECFLFIDIEFLPVSLLALIKYSTILNCINSFQND